jgi:predicted ATPase
MPRRPATKRQPEEGKNNEDDDKNDAVKSLQRKSRAMEASFQNAFAVLKESVQKLAQKYERAFKEEDDEEEEGAALRRARTTRDEAKRKVEKEKGKSPMGKQMREQMAKRIAEASESLEKKREKVAKEVKK